MNIAPEQLARQLESELGVDAVTADPTELASHNVDGIEPVLVCAPREPEQVAAAIRTCAEADATLIPWGGGTAMALGNPPRRAEVILSTVRLNRLIDHDHANLTVTAGSGLVLSVLQTALLSHTQFVAIDPPYPDRSTIGGIVAANLNGPRRSYYGSVRDLVIGMKVVLGSGAQIKAGGKVVKIVAGYDMSKLFECRLSRNIARPLLAWAHCSKFCSWLKTSPPQNCCPARLCSATTPAAKTGSWRFVSKVFSNPSSANCAIWS
jgi:glycolate oxidase FAD binding subunit